ncbi:ATP-grasp domain-containing protein [Blastococcus sp. SYSU DS0533]
MTVPGDRSADPWFASVEVQVRGTAARPEFAAGERLDAAGAAVLERARARGLRTAVLTRDRDVYGEDLDWVVDRWIDCDTHEADGIVGAVLALGGTAAVCGAAPGSAGPAAVAARALGLRGPTPGSPAVTGDRGGLHRALAAAGLAGVRWAEVAADAEDLTSPVGYPCVVRPAGGDAGRAGLVSDERELRELATRHLAGVDHGRAPRRRLVVEEHVPGPRFGADGFSDGGNHVVLGWSEIVTAPPPLLDHLLRTVTRRPPVPHATGWVRGWLAAAGHDAGPFSLEFVVGPTGPRLVEVATGLAGDGAHACVEQVSGVDTADLVVARLLGEPAAGPAQGGMAGACTQLHLTAHAAGRVRAVAGVRDVGAIPGLVVAEIFTDVGSATGPATGLPGRLGHVVTVGETPEQSRRRAAAALDGIHVVIDGPDAVPSAPRPGVRACEDGPAVVGRRRARGPRTS